ncbi:hypothetical protein [Kitasatospora sp. NPDC089509]|uniref:hypothetical protein n=1 Tax=Kitasatospora sp. NPDC089509 TaxID=3364079 RepID=UPI003808C769
MSPTHDERARIRAAMDRILTDTATHSNGALTIVALAIEADVPRNALTQRHPDLKNEFYEKVSALGAVPDAEARLRATTVKLRTTIANKNEEIAQLRTDRDALIRAVNQLTLENQHLRERPGPGPSLIPFPDRRSNRAPQPGNHA